MLFLKETSVTNWISKLRSDELLATIIGCSKDNTPSLGAHYDFISRLWLSSLAIDRVKLKRTYSFKKKPSISKSPSKNKKLPNKRPGVVRKVVAFFFKGKSFSRHQERLLQKIFTLVAVEPSAELNLIIKDNLTIAGDGTAVHCHPSYY